MVVRASLTHTLHLFHCKLAGRFGGNPGGQHPGGVGLQGHEHQVRRTPTPAACAHNLNNETCTGTRYGTCARICNRPVDQKTKRIRLNIIRAERMSTAIAGSLWKRRYVDVQGRDIVVGPVPATQVLSLLRIAKRTQQRAFFFAVGLSFSSKPTAPSQPMTRHAREPVFQRHARRALSRSVAGRPKKHQWPALKKRQKS